MYAIFTALFSQLAVNTRVIVSSAWQLVIFFASRLGKKGERKGDCVRLTLMEIEVVRSPGTEENEGGDDGFNKVPRAS